MAFLIDGQPLAENTPFTVGDINYPANWLKFATGSEKTALKITEVADPAVYDGRFYNSDGSAKSLVDVNATYEEDDPSGAYKKGDAIKDYNGNQIVNYGVKSVLKANEKATADSLLKPYDWYVIRKIEKDIAIPSEITTYRDAVRTACDTREKEIDACSDTAALVTLYSFKEDGTAYMTQYPNTPSS